MLSRIQRMLAELYDVGGEHDVLDFVCGPELLEATVGPGHRERGEVLLVSQEGEAIHVALYLDPDVLASLEAPARSAAGWSSLEEDFRALCLATEGVSHFLYLTFRAGNAEQVSQLELELQAEVDKYAAGMLAGNGVGAFRARSRALRERLFHGVRFLDDADTVEGERYRVAHHAAARYVAALEARYVDEGRLEELWTELRRFYRLGAREKLERVRM